MTDRPRLGGRCMMRGCSADAISEYLVAPVSGADEDQRIIAVCGLHENALEQAMQRGRYPQARS